VLLLSDREADAVVEAAWTAPRAAAAGSPPPPLLLHHAHARAEPAPAWLTLQARPGGAHCRGGAAAVDDDALARLQLYNGEKMLGGDARGRALEALLPTSAARDAALLLPPMRGLGHLVSRSQLEDICLKAAAGDEA
jgi:hypothetical protein